MENRIIYGKLVQSYRKRLYSLRKRGKIGKEYDGVHLPARKRFASRVEIMRRGIRMLLKRSFSPAGLRRGPDSDGSSEPPEGAVSSSSTESDMVTTIKL